MIQLKKMVLMGLIVGTALNGNAQYKKASFFTRNGKFYGLQAGLRAMSGGSSMAPSVAFVAGRDKGTNNIWHWWDLEVVMPFKYSYTTPDMTTGGATTAKVSGKTKAMFVIRYNWSYYFGDNKNRDIKGLPFVKIGIEADITSSRSNTLETVEPSTASPEKFTYLLGPSGGADLGLGYAYHINESATIFGVAGYRLMLNKTTGSGGAFYTDPSHPYINIGVRFARKNED